MRRITPETFSINRIGRFHRIPALFLIIFLLLFISVTAHGEPRPRIGLVLSGGGARGIAHIGVLKVLE